MAGTTIDWYDFFLYGATAALASNEVFFPTLDPILGIATALLGAEALACRLTPSASPFPIRSRPTVGPSNP